MATSPATEEAASALGLAVEPFDGLDRLDLAIDGADQVAPDGWLVKGGGGAHTREKVVAAAAERFVVVADSSKTVRGDPRSGSGRAAALRPRGDVARARDAESARTRRRSPDGNVIADYTGEVGDPDALAARLAAVPGVIEHGLFPPAMVSEVIVGRGERAERLQLTGA